MNRFKNQLHGMEPERRFWRRVTIGDGCWEWSGNMYHDGYGMFNVDERKVRAHRFSYEIMVGPIPGGLQIDHLCRNRACVRFDHLEPVTQRENIRRGNSLSGMRARATHCIRGHAFDEENTYWAPNGSRRCRTCIRASQATNTIQPWSDCGGQEPYEEDFSDY